MKTEQRNELLYQALETELGGVQVYTTALGCAVNEELKKEWQEYLDQTQNHVEIVRGIFEKRLDLIQKPIHLGEEWCGTSASLW